MSRDPLPIPFSSSWSYSLQFPRDPRGPRVTRVTLRAVLVSHGLVELADRAEVLASELITNALRHTAGTASVSLNWRYPAFRFSVWDASPQLPELPRTTPPPDAVSGRGLLLLETLADRWGGCTLDDSPWGPGGKTLWFELLLGGGDPASIAPAAA